MAYENTSHEAKLSELERERERQREIERESERHTHTEAQREADGQSKLYVFSVFSTNVSACARVCARVCARLCDAWRRVVSLWCAPCVWE